MKVSALILAGSLAAANATIYNKTITAKHTFTQTSECELPTHPTLHKPYPKPNSTFTTHLPTTKPATSPTRLPVPPTTTIVTTATTESVGEDSDSTDSAQEPVPTSGAVANKAGAAVLAAAGLAAACLL